MSRLLPAFSVGASIVYLVALYFHPRFTMFTFIPRLGTWAAGVPALPPNQAPGMYWYAWLTAGLIGGLAVAAVAAIAPESMRTKAPSAVVWTVPIIMTLILIYIEKSWFGF